MERAFKELRGEGYAARAVRSDQIGESDRGCVNGN